ncbi:hypothetical protein KVV02_001472 [Mortierella alpina]|uniref:FHA domain-containing protein n=1 Tax=Mortierella alpina TaxID=64518 RepID=A0A9P8D215_MORAP|nr:hypothetical protein KVV02_001472 [Mortierella alpina]
MNGGNSTTMSTINGRHQASSSNPILVLEPIDESFQLKSLELPEQTKVKIGRQTGVTTAPHPSNGYFDSKVLSRIHAEVWSESSKVYIRDLKSSNGTFLNGKRLCPENTESEPFELNQNDNLEFGIDIMDENGACKSYLSATPMHYAASNPLSRVDPLFYISRSSHAKLKSSPSGSGVNSVKTTSFSAHGGQSDNMDLIFSRLQNELLRSQETYADLGFLKQGLSDLEKSLVVNGRETDSKVGSAAIPSNGQPAGINILGGQTMNASAIEMEKALKEKIEQQTAEVQRLEAELEALRAANDSLNRGLQQNQEALFQAGLNMERVEDTIKEMTVHHAQELESSKKERDVALACVERLGEKHRDELERVVLEADSEKAVLMAEHKSELDQLRTKLETGSGQDQRTMEDELQELKQEIRTLRQADDMKAQVVEKLTKEVDELILQLDDTKAELKSLQQIDDMKHKGNNNNGRLETLTPTPPSTSTSTDTTRNDSEKERSKDGIDNTTESTAGASPWLPSTTQFSWSQFVFPIAKRNQPFVNQPSTMLLSGGFVLVGLGVYALWHKAGMPVN